MKVTISAVGLTPDDYVRSGCDAALAACPRRWKSDYEIAVAERSWALQEAGNEQGGAASRVMLAVLSVREPWSQAPVPAEDDPYWPTYEFDDSAYAYLPLLLGLDPVAAPTIADVEVRARAADHVYLRSVSAGGRRNFRAAKLAVESYLAEAAWQERHDEQWHQSEARVARALAIVAELNNGPLGEKVVEHIDAALALYSAPKSPTPDGPPPTIPAPSRYPALLMKLLLNHFKKGDSVAHTSLAERLAQEALAAKSWEMSRKYLGVAALEYKG